MAYKKSAVLDSPAAGIKKAPLREGLGRSRDVVAEKDLGRP